VIDEHLLIFTICKVALLSVPKVCLNVIGCIARLYVYDLFHDKVRGTIWRAFSTRRRTVTKCIGVFVRQMAGEKNEGRSLGTGEFTHE
jgi:hypothetical protein